MYLTSKHNDRFDRTSGYYFSKEPMKNVDIPYSITLNRNKTYQKFLGFGGAFTDAAGINIGKLPLEMQTRLIRDYFSDDGLMYTFGRVPIGGTDFSTRAYTYDDNPRDNLLSKFALQDEDLKHKIPFIKMAQDASSRPLKLFGSTWSPPAWMKTNDNLKNGGQLIGEPGEKYYKMFAEYLVKFVLEYKKQNITMWGLTIVNEPVIQGDTDQSPNQKFNSLEWNSTLERDFLKYDLGPLLSKSSLSDLKLMIFDNNIPTMSEYIQTVLSDKEAAKYVAGIAYHWYSNLKADRKVLDLVAQKFPNNFLISTEACILRKTERDRVWLGEWAPADQYAEDIIRDLNQNTAGWVDWNLALDKQGGPNYVQNWVDATIIVNWQEKEYFKQPAYYALAHFSRFIVPDSIRIEHTENSRDTDNLMVTVFERPDKGMVMTFLNKKDRQVLVEVYDPAHGYHYFNLGSHTIATLIWYWGLTGSHTPPDFTFLDTWLTIFWQLNQ